MVEFHFLKGQPELVTINNILSYDIRESHFPQKDSHFGIQIFPCEYIDGYSDLAGQLLTKTFLLL